MSESESESESWALGLGTGDDDLAEGKVSLIGLGLAERRFWTEERETDGEDVIVSVPE